MAIGGSCLLGRPPKWEPNTFYKWVGWIGPEHQTQSVSPGLGWPRPGQWVALPRATLPNTLFEPE